MPLLTHSLGGTLHFVLFALFLGWLGRDFSCEATIRFHDVSLTANSHIIFELLHDVKAASGTIVDYGTSFALISMLFANRFLPEANNMEMGTKLAPYSTVVPEMVLTSHEKLKDKAEPTSWGEVMNME